MIKATTAINTPKEIDYPKLMSNKLSCDVFLFFEPYYGVKLSPNSVESGIPFNCHDMSCFVDFTGSITLFNN